MKMEQFSRLVLTVLYINLAAILVNVCLVESTVKNFKLNFEHVFFSCLGYFASHFAIELMYKFFKKHDKFINKDLRKGETWDLKLLRQAENFGGAMFNLLDILILYGTFYKTEYWPAEFGGRMDLYSNRPLEVQQQSSTAQRYYIFYLGHYLHRLMHHIQSAQGSSTYYQMLLHHCLTPALVFISMLQNIQQWGFAIFACFAFSNFYLNISRWFKDSIFPQIITQILLLVFIVDWTWKRVYYYNLIVTKSIVVASYEWIKERPDLFPLFFFYLFFLSIIGVLNFYWCIKLIKIAVDKIVLKNNKSGYEEGQVLKRKT